MTGDLYVLAYTFTPEFCYGNDYPGCAKPLPFWKNHFTLHGLWPQYSAGGYPQTCTTEAYDVNSAKNVGMETMIQYWPDVQYAYDDPEYDQFWEHEWSKHGTCSGLSQDDYFQTAINMIKSFGTPQSFIDAAGTTGTIDAATLRNDMGGASYVSLQCLSGKYIDGAYTCWKEENGVPTTQTECPSDVQQEDTCTSTTLTIQSI